MHKLIEVKPLAKYSIWVKYKDGTQGEVNLSHLAGKGVFKLWEDKNNFNKVYIDEESNAIAWNKDIDICPDSVYFKLKNVNLQQLFN